MPHSNPPPHIRCTFSGTLGTDEIFQFSLNIAETNNSPFAQWFGLDPNGAHWDDIANDAAQMWVLGDAHIGSEAVLRKAKFAMIGSDGKYTTGPIERLIGGANGVAGGGDLRGPRTGFQMAQAVTLHTPGDMTRVKGRFYLPAPRYNVGADGRIPLQERDECRTAVKNFLNDVNNEPGIDQFGLQVVVASAGRHDRFGAQRVAPKNWTVDNVSVGRVLDTIRTRRNKLTEDRGALQPVV